MPWGKKMVTSGKKEKSVNNFFQTKGQYHGKKSHYVLSTLGEADSTCFNLLRIPMIIEPDQYVSGSSRDPSKTNGAEVFENKKLQLQKKTKSIYFY